MATKQINKLKDGRCETLYAELHTLLQAGLDFSNAFALLIAGERDRQMRTLWQRLFDGVVAGASLAEAMERSGAFRALDCGVIRIGDQTGQLTEALDFLCDYYRKRAEQRRMVSSAVSYPLVILGVAVAVVAFMLAVVVPMFEQVYARMGGELPALTQAIIRLSQAFPRYALGLALVGGVCGGLLYRYRRSESVRARSAALLLRLPLVGNIVRRHYEAHFCKLLYLLTSSGIPLLDGVGMLDRVIDFYPYQQSFRSICRGLERGGSFAECLAADASLYDPKLAALMRVGEETNRLPEMLRRQSESLTRELEYRIRQLGTMLEPLLILFVGVLVAVILIAMYMPMFRLGGIMG